MEKPPSPDLEQSLPRFGVEPLQVEPAPEQSPSGSEPLEEDHNESKATLGPLADRLPLMPAFSTQGKARSVSEELDKCVAEEDPQGDPSDRQTRDSVPESASLPISANPLQLRCWKHHLLERCRVLGRGAGVGWACDVCHVQEYVATWRFRCISCDFDLCDKCSMSPLCSKGHVLSLNTLRSGSPWICDGCEKMLGNGTVARYSCPCCDFDICGTCHSAHPKGRSLTAPASAPVCSELQRATSLPPATDKVPETAPSRVSGEGDFVELHNNVAMPLMRNAVDLGKAFQALVEANRVHLHMYGRPSCEAFYNMACCLSLGAAAVLVATSRASLRDPAPGLPPQRSGLGIWELVDARLDLAGSMLEAAVVSGYLDVVHMASDPDLAAFRGQRPHRFRSAIQMAERGAQG